MSEIDPKLDPNNEFHYDFPIFEKPEELAKLRSDVQNYNELKNESEELAQQYLNTTVYKAEDMILAEAMLKYNDRNISLSLLQERAFEVQIEFNEQFLDNRRVLHQVTGIPQEEFSNKNFITLMNDKLSSRKKLTRDEKITMQTFYGVADDNGNAQLGILPPYIQDDAERNELIHEGQKIVDRVLNKLKASSGAENIVADTIASQGNMLKFMNVMNTPEAAKEISDFNLIKAVELERIKTTELMPALKASHKASPEGPNKLFTAVFKRELPKQPEAVVENVAEEVFEEKSKPGLRERLKNSAKSVWKEVTQPAILITAGAVLLFSTIGILGNRQNKKSNDVVNNVKQNTTIVDTSKKLGTAASSITKITNVAKPAAKKIKRVIVQEAPEQDEQDNTVSASVSPKVMAVADVKTDVQADTAKQTQTVVQADTAKQTITLNAAQINAMATKVDSAKTVVVDTAVKKDVVKADSVIAQPVATNTVIKDSTAKIDSAVKVDTAGKKSFFARVFGKVKKAGEAVAQKEVELTKSATNFVAKKAEPEVKADTVKAQVDTAQTKFKANAADTATQKTFVGKTLAKFKKAGLAVAQKEADLTKSAANLVTKKPEPEVKAKSPKELIDEKYKALEEALDKNNWQYKYQYKQLEFDKKIENLKLSDDKDPQDVMEKIHKVEEKKMKTERERTEDPNFASSTSSNARAMVVPVQEVASDVPVLAAVDIMVENGESVVTNRRRPNPGQSAMVRRHSNSSLAQRRF